MRRLSVFLLFGLAAAACGDDESDAPPDLDPDEPVTERIDYGPDPLQFGDLTVPAGDGPFPVVVFIHGGFWRNSFGLDLAEPQAADAVRAGYATWNIEYRRVGDPGGGYPGTLADVAAAVDHIAALADSRPLDVNRVAVVGHSAGGHLALWVGQRGALRDGVPGAAPAVVPTLVVGQAPVADLANNLDLGGGAVLEFIGGPPDAQADAFDVADPARLGPVVVPQLIVQGRDDLIVPPDRAAAYVAAVGSALVDVRYFDDADHFDVIDPVHESWTAVLNRLAEPTR